MSCVEDFFLSFFDFVGHMVCHQLPERTLWVGGYYLPVCARDTGVYLGLLLGYFLLPLRKKQARGPPNLWIVAFMVTPMILDSGTQWIGLRSSTNELRLITGLFFGTAIAPLLVYLLPILPSGGKVPILGRLTPMTAELDDKNPWLANQALAIGSLVSVASFFAISSMTGSSNSLFYWVLSSAITTSVIWHVFVFPILLISLVLASTRA